MDATRQVIRQMLLEAEEPVVYLDLDETLVHQTLSPSTRIREKPVAKVGGYTIWVRPGAPEAVQRLLEAVQEVHVMTTGTEDHQAEVIEAVFPGFPGTVYSARPGSRRVPDVGRPWILVDDLPWYSMGVQSKAAILGAEQGRLIQVEPYIPVKFSRLAAKTGRPQKEPEDGSILMAAFDEITKVTA